MLSLGIFNFSAHALIRPNFDMSYEKHISGRYLKKLTSLSEDHSSGRELIKADEKDGYKIEIERMIEGFAGPTLEKDLFQKQVKIGLGIEFTGGMTFVNSKKVKNFVEADEFAKNSATDYFSAKKALKMEPEENAHFDMFAGIVLAPQVSKLGVWCVSTGGWDVNVTKKENDILEVEFALLNSKTASFYFDTMGAMISYDVGKELENGYKLTLNLKDPKAQEAYERLFKGNILFAQTEAKKNKNIKFLKNSTSSKYVKGMGLWVRSPLISWFLLNSTQHLTKGEKSEFDYETNIRENSLTSSYEEETELDFLGAYFGSIRIFETNYNLEKKEYAFADHFEIESNQGNNIIVALSKMLSKTRMNEYFELNIPSIPNKYFHVKLDVLYNEKFFKHLVTGKVDSQEIIRNAHEEHKKYYDKILAQYYKHEIKNIQPIYSLLDEKRFAEQMIFIVSNRFNNYIKDTQKAYLADDHKAVVENLSVMMKYIYKSPAFYKAFVDYSKHCATQIQFEVETQAFAKKNISEQFKEDSHCTE